MRASPNARRKSWGLMCGGSEGARARCLRRLDVYALFQEKAVQRAKERFDAWEDA
jgi:hypothetical protein